MNERVKRKQKKKKKVCLFLTENILSSNSLGYTKVIGQILEYSRVVLVDSELESY